MSEVKFRWMLVLVGATAFILLLGLESPALGFERLHLPIAAVAVQYRGPTLKKLFAPAK
jgi:hypothetical protein